MDDASLKEFAPMSLPLTALSIVFLLNALPAVWSYANRAPAMDFFTVWAVPHVLAHKTIDDIYSLEGRKELLSDMKDELTRTPHSQQMNMAFNIVSKTYDGRLETTATPFFYTVFGIAETGQYMRDRLRFTVFSLACLLLSAVILCRILKIPAHYTILFLAIFLSSFAPFYSELMVGNVNQIQLFLLSLFILFFIRSEHVFFALCSGFTLGLTIMFKPNIFMIFLFVIMLKLAQGELRKAFQVLAGAVFSVILALSASIAYFKDVHIWGKWFVVIKSRLADYSDPMANGNLSLAKTIFDTCKIKTSLALHVLIAAIFLLFIFYLKRIGRPSRDKLATDAFMVYGFGCTCIFLASALAWGHYYTLLLPLLIYLLRPFPGDIPAGNISAPIAKSLSFLAFFMLTTVAFAVTPHSPVANAVLANASVMLMLLSAMFQVTQEYRMGPGNFLAPRSY